MHPLRLIIREILHRKLNFALSLLAIVTAVALLVTFFTTGQGATRETRRLMRDMGFNLRIIPGSTDMADFWASGYSPTTMPEAHVHRLATRAGLSYAHLGAMLQRRIRWRGSQVLLTGILPELAPPSKVKPPMYTPIAAGHASLGATVAARLDVHVGDEIDLRGTRLRVTRRLPPSGSMDDIRVYTHLHDAQRILGLPGRINEIRALQCLCLVEGVNLDSIAVLRAQMRAVLPDVKVVRLQAIADAREQQRLMMQQLFAFAMPLVVIVCLVWIGVMALLNVRERTQEIGVMRALGHGSARIALLFLGKAAIIGILGALFGYALGTALALHVGPRLFTVTAASLEPAPRLLLEALWAAPVFCALAAAVPTLWGVLQDPARSLREA